MKIVAMMPIKLNNQRLPGKNIKLLKGKPLLQHNLEMLKSVKQIDEIYVYCSDESICDFLPEKIKFLKRSKNLDSDNTNCTQFLENFIKDIDADIYILSHATAPFVSPCSVEKCLKSVIEEEFDSAFTASKIQDFLWTSDLKPLNFNPSNIPRSQDLPIFYRETSGVYVFKKEVFLNSHQRIGKNPNVIEVSFKEAVDINEESDFILAENLCENDNFTGGG